MTPCFFKGLIWAIVRTVVQVRMCEQNLLSSLRIDRTHIRGNTFTKIFSHWSVRHERFDFRVLSFYLLRSIVSNGNKEKKKKKTSRLASFQDTSNCHRIRYIGLVYNFLLIRYRSISLDGKKLEALSVSIGKTRKSPWNVPSRVKKLISLYARTLSSLLLLGKVPRGEKIDLINRNEIFQRFLH